MQIVIKQLGRNRQNSQKNPTSTFLFS